MGLKNRDGGKTNYVKVKDGKFYLSTDKELTAPFDELSGVITDTYLKDEEYKGIPSRKFYTVFEDEGERFIIGFNIESSFASTFISFLMNADLAQPVTIVPRVETINKNGTEVQKRSILVSQNGRFLKAYFTKDNPNGLPQMEKIERRGGKIEWNKDEMLDFYEGLILNKFKVEANKNKGAAAPAIRQEVTGDQPVSTERTVTTKLPWSEGVGSEASDDDLPF